MTSASQNLDDVQVRFYVPTGSFRPGDLVTMPAEIAAGHVAARVAEVVYVPEAPEADEPAADESEGKEEAKPDGTEGAPGKSGGKKSQNGRGKAAGDTGSPPNDKQVETANAG